jgi:hypothetical protein
MVEEAQAYRCITSRWDGTLKGVFRVCYQDGRDVLQYSIVTPERVNEFETGGARV